MIVMQKKRSKNIFSNDKGFSLLEVLLGVTVFMIGMLGITALNISSLKSNTFSGNLSEATIIAADKIEELMSLDYTDLPATTDPDLKENPADLDGTGQDLPVDNDDGIDDDAFVLLTHDDDTNFGLDDVGIIGTDPDPSDHNQLDQGKNGIYDIYWNIAEGEPFDFCKRINVIVVWSIKDVQRQININTIRCREM